MPITAPTAVYRLYATDGALLYVGITDSPGRRWREHAHQREWWGDVESFTLEWHDYLADARAAELKAIRCESPRHNYVGAVGRHRRSQVIGQRVRFDIKDDLYAEAELRASIEGIDVEAWMLNAFARIVDEPEPITHTVTVIDF